MKTAKPRRSYPLIILGSGALLTASMVSVGCASAAGPEDISTTREADLVLRDAQADVQQVDAAPVDAAPDPCNMAAVTSAIAWTCCYLNDSWHDAVYCLADDCSQLCSDHPPTDALVACYPDPEMHGNDCFRACTHGAQADVDRSAAAGTCGKKKDVGTHDAGTATALEESAEGL